MIREEAINHLFRVGRFPAGANLAEFAKRMTGIIESYQAVRVTPPVQANRYIRDLKAAVDASEHENDDNKRMAICAAFNKLPADLKKLITGSDGKGCPSTEEIEFALRRILYAPAPRRNRTEAAEIQRQAHSKRRGRPGGRRTDPNFLRDWPRPLRGKQVVTWQEILLAAFVLQLWADTSGGELPKTVRPADDSRLANPAVALLAEVLAIVGYREHTAVTLFKTWNRLVCLTHSNG